MEQVVIRLLKAEEIECRIGTINEKGVSLLLYKNSRVDQKILDETFGCFGWQRHHQCINGNLYCTVSIYNAETKEWVSKQDVGVESNTEKEKGQASDAFKRACFNWGIGRELYTCPFVWINLDSNEWKMTTAGRKQPLVRFSVKEIEYQDNKVCRLVIVDDRGRERFSYGTNLGYDDKLGAAVLDVEACKTVDELKSLYFAYEKQFKNDQRFLDAVNHRKAQLEKVA